MWFGATVSLTCLVCLGFGLLIREHFRAGYSSWLIEPVLYLARDQHRSRLFSFLPPTWLLIGLWLAMCALAVLLIRTIHRDRPGLSILPDVMVGLFVGGSLANVIEVFSMGSVTDFLGIHWLGVFSAGDIAIDAAASLAPIAAAQIVWARNRTSKRALQTGAVFAAAVAIYGAVGGHDYLIVVLVTLVAAAGAVLYFAWRSGARSALRRPRLSKS
jgi:hypothetical protein